MRRYVYIFYGIVAYVLFLAAFTYLIGFAGNIAVPKSVDSGTENGILQSVLINCGLIALFGVQHSVMARPEFKRRWTKIIPQPIERSTYVLFTSIVLVTLYVFWQPITVTMWNVESGAGKVILYSIFGLGWAISVFVSYLINHFELFGLQQVYFNLRQQMISESRFITPSLYKIVRHPMQFGMIMGLWAIPHMTVAHFLFASGMTVYIVIGVHYEERDLVKVFGEEYRGYQTRVPKLLPIASGNRQKARRSALLSTREILNSYIHLKR